MHFLDDFTPPSSVIAIMMIGMPVVHFQKLIS